MAAKPTPAISKIEQKMTQTILEKLRKLKELKAMVKQLESEVDKELNMESSDQFCLETEVSSGKKQPIHNHSSSEKKPRVRTAKHTKQQHSISEISKYKGYKAPKWLR